MASTKKLTVALKGVKEIVVRFCPFESNVRSTRMFLAKVGSEKARATNMNCDVKAVVKHDKSEPIVDITYVDGDRLVLKGAHLTFDEMMGAFQLRRAPKDPQGKTLGKS